MKIIITVEDRAQVADIVRVLTDAEEEGDLDFPFDVQVTEDS